MAALWGEHWQEADSSEKLGELPNWWSAAGLWDHLESASGVGVPSAGHLGELPFVAVGATCAVEGLQLAGACRVAMQVVVVVVGRSGGFVSVQFVRASGREVVLASSDDAAGVCSSVESDSPGIGLGSHFADEAAADQRTAAGSGGVHLAVGVYTHGDTPVRPEEMGVGLE